MSLAAERCLPWELWGEVFLFSIPDRWDRQVYDYRRAVMLPGRVCREWNEIALATPRMWSSIALNVKEGNEEIEFALATAWLARSRSSPLNIRLHQLSLMPEPSIIDAIVAHCERWWHITFIMPAPMLYGLAAAKDRLPRLVTLAISCTKFDAPWTMPLEAFEVAPQLLWLTIGNQVSPFLLRVPWDQLEKFSQLESFGPWDSHLSSDEGLEVLRQSTDIVRAELILEDIQPLRSCPAVENKLEELLLQVHSDPAWFFDHLTLPFLLELEFYEDRGSWAQPQFISLLARSGCALESLTLCFQEATMSEDDLISILQLTPALDMLVLEFDAMYALTSNVLRRLSRRVSEDGEVTCLLPNLQSMTIHRYNNLDDLAFIDMVESRWRVGHPGEILAGGDTKYPRIRTLFIQRWDELESCREFNPVALARLRQLEREGLDLYMIRDISDESDDKVVFYDVKEGVGRVD